MYGQPLSDLYAREQGYAKLGPGAKKFYNKLRRRGMSHPKAYAKALQAMKDYRDAKKKARMKQQLKTSALAFPDSAILSVSDQVAKTQTLHAAQYFLGRPALSTPQIEKLKKRSAQKVIHGKLSAPAARAKKRLAARKAAQDRIKKLSLIRKRRRLTPQEILRLKTDTEAILSVAVPPKDVIKKGMSFLPPKRKRQKLWLKPHMRKRFPKGKRPRKVKQVIALLQENNLLQIAPGVAEPALKVLLPKIRSRRVSPLAAAKVLKSAQARKLAEVKYRRNVRRKKMTPLQRQHAKRFQQAMAKLKLMQKRLRTLQRMHGKFLSLNDLQAAAQKAAEAATLETQVAGQEAEILTEAVNEGPAVQADVENQIAVSIAEADLEDLAEEIPEPTEEELLAIEDSDETFVIEAQIAALLDEAAPTIDDAVPEVIAEADTPAVDPDVIEQLEAQSGETLDSDQIVLLADEVSVQMADDMITQGAATSGRQATTQNMMETLQKNLPLLLIGGAVAYYVLFAKK